VSLLVLVDGFAGGLEVEATAATTASPTASACPASAATGTPDGVDRTGSSSAGACASSGAGTSGALSSNHAATGGTDNLMWCSSN
jgi:hypothetical protein